MGFISRFIDTITGKDRLRAALAERDAELRSIEEKRISSLIEFDAIRAQEASLRRKETPPRASGTERRKNMLSTEARNLKGGYAPPPPSNSGKAPGRAPTPSTSSPAPARRRPEDDATDILNPLNPLSPLSPINNAALMHHATYGSGYVTPEQKPTVEDCPTRAPTYHSPPSESYSSPPSSYDSSPSSSSSYDSPSSPTSYD
jgi:hypothetical protein